MLDRVRSRTGRDSGVGFPLDDCLVVRQVQIRVRERAGERRVELARLVVALPPLAARDDFINAVRGRSGDEAIQVAVILSLGVVDPKTAPFAISFAAENCRNCWKSSRRCPKSNRLVTGDNRLSMLC